MSLPNPSPICQISSDGKTCNLPENLAIIYNGLEPVNFTTNDQKLFSSASDASIQAPNHSQYLKEVRQVYNFLNCPNQHVEAIVNPDGTAEGKENTQGNSSNSIDTGTPYAEIIENSTCQMAGKPTVFQDPCNPLGVFPNVDENLGVDKDADTNAQHFITNLYCKSGSPQKQNLMYGSIAPSIDPFNLLNEERDLITAQSRRTKKECNKSLIPGEGNTSVSNGAWIPTYDLILTAPDFNIETRDVNYKKVQPTLNAGKFLSPTNAPTLSKVSFEYTLNPLGVRGSLAQAELACTKEQDNCSGFLLSNDLKTSYLLGPTVTPTMLSEKGESPKSEFIFYYQKNNGTPTAPTKTPVPPPPNSGGMCIPQYYDCSTGTTADLCNKKSKCVWATPVNKYPTVDTDLNSIYPVDKPGCYPLDYDGASTVLDPDSIVFSQTLSQSLVTKESGEIVWYNDFNPEYKHDPSDPLLKDIEDFKENCRKIKGKVVGVKETQQINRPNDINAGADEAFLVTASADTLYAPSGEVQYYCIPKTKLAACGIGNSRGDAVQCCSGAIVNTKDQPVLNLGNNINGPICIGGGHPLGPPCQEGKHTNSVNNNNNATPTQYQMLGSPTCTSVYTPIACSPTSKPLPSSSACSPTCYKNPGGPPTADSPTCAPTKVKRDIPAVCKESRFINTYDTQQQVSYENIDDGTQYVGWTYQSFDGTNSDEDPSELIYPGGAGELITNNPNACWYNEEIMTTGSTPDNIIMSQFRSPDQLPVIRAGSTLRNDSCWAYKSGWKSAEEISPVDYTGGDATTMGAGATPASLAASGSDPTGPDQTPDHVSPPPPPPIEYYSPPPVKEGYTPPNIPATYNAHDYSWFAKPVGFTSGIPYGGEFTGQGSKTVEIGDDTDDLGQSEDDTTFTTYQDNLQANTTQQFYNMGWNGGYIKNPGQYTYNSDKEDDRQIPNFSLSWLGGCNPITSTSNTSGYTTFNTMSYNYNACGNNCGGNCVMCNNWPENQVAKWNDSGERKRSYINWLPCKLNKSVNHLATSLVCRNCGPLNESNVPNYNNNPSTPPAAVGEATNNYLWYPEWKLVGGVNGLWMQSSDGMCRATKKLRTSNQIPQYPQIKMAWNPAGVATDWPNGGCPKQCDPNMSGTPSANCISGNNLMGSGGDLTDSIHKSGLQFKQAAKQMVNGSDGQGCTLAWSSPPSGLGQQINGADILEGNINSNVYQKICQTFPSDQVHIPYTLWSGMFPVNSRNKGASTNKYMQAGDNFGNETYLTRIGRNAPYPNFAQAYPGSWCLTSIDQVYLATRTGANVGSGGTTHYRKMFSMGLSTPPNDLDKLTSFPLKAFTFSTTGGGSTVWPTWGNDCGNQGQWDNQAIRAGANSATPLNDVGKHVALKRLQAVSKVLATPSTAGSPSNKDAQGFGGSLAVLPFGDNSYAVGSPAIGWHTGGGGYNAHAGVVQQDGGSCASGRMICNNSYTKTPSGNALPGDPRCMGGANYNVGLSSETAGTGDSPFGGTYMCWPENDDSYVGSGYAQTERQCSTSAQPGGETLQSGTLDLPVSSSKSCQEDSDCREGGGCIWSATNNPELAMRITGLTPGTASPAVFKERDTQTGTEDMSFMSVAYEDPGSDLTQSTWVYGQNNFTTAGRWPLADQSMNRAGSRCHKPTNLCIADGL